MRILPIGIGVGFALLGSAVLARDASEWNWLFPSASTPGEKVAESTVYHLPGSDRSFTEAQTKDRKHVVDWYPQDHPAAPPVVLASRGSADACGFCHLATGDGRPENAALSGLPADYIERQVEAFAHDMRKQLPYNPRGGLMPAVAKAVTPEESKEAAAYFSKLRYHSHVRVVETAALAFAPYNSVYILSSGTARPIGSRIIEVPLDPTAFERRDSRMSFVAFVEPGTVAAGRALAASGGPAGQPCASCHGEGLRGAIAPPLAGRSPTSLLRQLAEFQVGTRHDAEAEPMRTIVRDLQSKQMIALAAYAATLKP
jgi:cytochrome c553